LEYQSAFFPANFEEGFPGPGSNRFTAMFLLENLHLFHIVEDKISMYLSTEPENVFVEVRGTGNLDFSSFLITTENS